MNTHISIHKKAYKTHRASLRDKTGQRTGVGVMMLCLRMGFIRPVEVIHTAFHLYSQHRMPSIGSFDFGGISHGRI